MEYDDNRIQLERTPDYAQYKSQLVKRTVEATDITKKILAKDAELMKQRYDSKMRSETFAEGDHVLLKRLFQKPGTSTKFAEHWQGKYTIVRIHQDKPTCEIESMNDPSAKRRTIHFDQIKKFQMKPGQLHTTRRGSDSEIEIVELPDDYEPPNKEINDDVFNAPDLNPESEPTSDVEPQFNHQQRKENYVPPQKQQNNVKQRYQPPQKRRNYNHQQFQRRRNFKQPRNDPTDSIDDPRRPKLNKSQRRQKAYENNVQTAHEPVLQEPYRIRAGRTINPPRRFEDYTTIYAYQHDPYFIHWCQHRWCQHTNK